MDYAVLDLGPEKLVARHVGPAEQVAFNESVLRESLASLEGQRFIVGDLGPAEKVEWSRAAPYASRAEFLGASYVIEGVFTRVGPGLMQLEVLSPDQRSAFARALLSVWIKKVAE